MNRKKILLLVAIFMLIGITGTTLNARANKPMFIDLDYNETDDILTATFVHGVTDPNYHYIFMVEIFVNESLVNTSFYNNQPSKNIFTYKYYNVTANFDDTIKLNATCTLEGWLEVEIFLGIHHSEPKGSFSSVIGPTIVSSVIVFGIVALPWINKKLKERR